MYVEGSLLLLAPYVGLVAGTVAFAGYLLAQHEKSAAEAADMSVGLAAASLDAVLRERLPQTKPGAVASLAKVHGLSPAQIRDLVESAPDESITSDFVGLRHLETSFGLSPADTAHVLHDLAGPGALDSLLWFTDDHLDVWMPADWLRAMEGGYTRYAKESPAALAGLVAVHDYLVTRQ